MSGVRRAARVAGPPLVVSVAMVGLWYLVTYAVLDPDRRFLLPPPHEVVSVAFLRARNLHELLDALWSTTQVAMVGLAIAIAVGMTWAIAMSQARWLERSLYPYAVLLQTIPILALVPVIKFWWGAGFSSRVVVCVLIALFPIISNTLFGIASIDRAHHDLFSLHGAGRLTRLRKLQLPAALPAVFTGFRISAGLSVLGAIVGDFFFQQGHPGIGTRIQRYANRLQSEQLLGAVLLSSLVGLLVFWIFGYLGNRAVASWHATGEQG